MCFDPKITLNVSLTSGFTMMMKSKSSIPQLLGCLLIMDQTRAGELVRPCLGCRGGKRPTGLDCTATSTPIKVRSPVLLDAES